ncbi:MAG: peptide-methionine (R)-S-oxide reductase MsrB [Gammaproteobacteria bacterium]|nr:peptide-methionine (R)-S-oxide reductase MsrB [Gammaproteobacteria bacterium]MDH3534212.1 peptide-methionine (R)-S-oxide reductase MsrB [Gammaproteobacteria bacterium]
MSNDEQWRAKLSAEEYRVCREKGTEPPFTGEYYHNHRSGSYLCKCCGEALFDSSHKYDSGSGWPSFDRPASEQAVRLEEDNSLGMRRVEVICDRCGCHLGHVFDDGPRDSTGKRYCINSLSLDFEASDDE